MQARRLVLAIALAGGIAAPLGAQTAPQTAIPAATPAAAAPPGDKPFVAMPVTDARLGTIAGQADVQSIIEAQNRATVSNNQVTGTSVTGDISFDASSFSDMNGLALVSANSGNNVAINASLNVNVSIHP